MRLLAFVCPSYLVEGKMSVLGRACPRYIVKAFLGKLTLLALSCPSYIVRGKILDATSVFEFLCSSK